MSNKLLFDFSNSVFPADTSVFMPKCTLFI